MRRLALLPLLLSLAACAPRATLPEPDRERTRHELSGQRRWLRVAVYAAPLYEDRSKMLVADAPLSELDLLETHSGKPIAPPPAEKVLPPGTPVRIADVEFPTGWIIARRVMMTPRYHPWVLLDVEGDPRRFVLVLPQETKSFEDARAEVDRVLSLEDPSAAFQALPQEQRDAILKKEPAEGMSARALEMAWGQPERKRIDRPARTEEWTWPEGKRRAFLEDEKVVRWERK